MDGGGTGATPQRGFTKACDRPAVAPGNKNDLELNRRPATHGRRWIPREPAEKHKSETIISDYAGLTRLRLLMKTLLFSIALTFFSLGCVTVRQDDHIHDSAHTARPPVVDIAVNLGLEHDGDLRALYDSLALRGVRCGMREMSLDAEQIVVESEDFERAKLILTDIITQHHLTVRLYKSPEFAKSPTNSLLEVWEKGQKVREEKYELYLSP